MPILSGVVTAGLTLLGLGHLTKIKDIAIAAFAGLGIGALHSGVAYHLNHKVTKASNEEAEEEYIYNVGREKPKTTVATSVAIRHLPTPAQTPAFTGPTVEQKAALKRSADSRGDKSEETPDSELRLIEEVLISLNLTNPTKIVGQYVYFTERPKTPDKAPPLIVLDTVNPITGEHIFKVPITNILARIPN